MEDKLAIDSQTMGNVAVLRLSGDLTKTTGESLLHFHPWEKGLGEGIRYLVINFSEVPYINSSGIALLIRIARAGRRAGYQTFGCGLSAHYRKLFHMVGLTEYMMIYPDEYSVLQRLGLPD